MDRERSIIERVEEHFCEQPYPYGESSGMFRKRRDSGLGDKLFTFDQALQWVETNEQLNKMWDSDEGKQ